MTERQILSQQPINANRMSWGSSSIELNSKNLFKGFSEGKMSPDPSHFYQISGEHLEQRNHFSIQSVHKKPFLISQVSSKQQHQRREPILDMNIYTPQVFLSTTVELNPSFQYKTGQQQRSKFNTLQSQRQSSEEQLVSQTPNLNIMSEKELKLHFKENQSIIESLNSNIENLFKKISQLTDQVYIEYQTGRNSNDKKDDHTNYIAEDYMVQKITESSKKLRISLEKDTKIDTQSNKCQENKQHSPNKQSAPSPANFSSPYQDVKLLRIRSSPKEQVKKYQIRELTGLPSSYKKYYYYSEAHIRSQQACNLFPELPISVSAQIRDFEIGHTLGYGKFGEALLCRHKQTGHLYTIKKIFKSSIIEYRMENQLLTQLLSLKIISHKNIVSLYTAFTDEFHIFLVMEFARGENLTKKFRSEERETARIIKQVLQAVKSMHQKGVVHRDIKPENVIYDGQVVKVCDLGWSAFLNGILLQNSESILDHDINNEKGNCTNIYQNKKMQTICGTLDYICPEMANPQSPGYTKLVDLWCIGVLTYQLLFGAAPFRAENQELTFNKIRNIQYSFSQGIEVSEEAYSFIRGLLQKQQGRLGVEEALQHSFISKYNTTQVQQAIRQNMQNAEINEFDKEFLRMW